MNELMKLLDRIRKGIKCKCNIYIKDIGYEWASGEVEIEIHFVDETDFHCAEKFNIHETKSNDNLLDRFIFMTNERKARHDKSLPHRKYR